MMWFRWYHGTCADPKLGSVARKTGQTRERVIACWALVLESASDATRRGVFAVDADGIADVLNCDSESVAMILTEFEQRGMTRRSTVVKWESRQPNRDDSYERVKRYRERTKGKKGVTRYTRDSNAIETRVTCKDTETDTEENILVPLGGTVERRRPTKPTGYTPEFVAAWQALPTRGGATNSKAAAFKAWTARVKEGVSVEEMTLGAHQYGDYCDREGRSGTPFVLQGATFFGPARHWEQYAKPRLAA